MSEYSPGALAKRQVIGTCRFGHKECAELLHFRTEPEEVGRLRAQLARANGLLRMVRDEPSLSRVKDVMGHDLIHGCIAVYLRDCHEEIGPDYHEACRAQHDPGRALK